ncbi:MAG: hypothetical protein ACD_7C00099G0004 [uncultured bacterium]|nr:MAG: hypothetical protein ACD_7C00099G0004 [uncultured bacterium]KKP68824.1 MAG: hypothetical protein UR66_C0003G0089 [Candidatus Moranbacteria bacterium GW2011_GWE1_35_17]KKP71669.1 MAG: hypothetical protein UR65_C0028G0006 [Candidatus Moranbacteria bacterium GW2011_GWE2_35_164]KKP84371.1 MAG: hypothetical protein UR83_C0022G0008 [Candidatus Moranbacteria bacterium GW2011_GWF2_35_54]HBR78982.1 hypothetical protein [Candidatus Moranbacteria bacterium]
MPENEINEETIIIRETFDLLTYTANIDGKDFFIKEAKSENGVAMNKREFYNQLFLKTMADGKDVGFEFLTPTLAGKRLIYPDITKYSTWLAKDFSPQTKMVPLKEYLQEMIKFMRFCLSMEFEQIPIELKKDTQKRVKNILDKFEKDAKYLLEHGLLEISDIKTLEEKVRSGLHLRNQAFQHHDIVPWHMARKHSDNRLILIDAGWSGWSLKYYDIAYYILQMIGYSERKNEASTFLDIVKKEFLDDSTFKETLAIPLSYRGIRLGAELAQQGKIKNARDVISLVLLEI